MVNALILTVTRACNLRCAYCPTAKDGWPSLDATDAVRAVELYAERFGGGDVKLFGGEPLLVPEVVRAVLDLAAALPAIRRVYLSTNGLGLDREWLARLAAAPKAVLTLSLDGRPGDHRRLRRALPGVADAYDHVLALLPSLLATPRVVVTQTIAPATAAHAAENFAHLVGLGFRAFNLLPGYYLPWTSAQLTSLRQSFNAIAQAVRAEWAAGRALYLRNLFTWAPTPFFNTGLVVDVDRSIHPSNLGLSALLDETRARTRIGTLDVPPTVEALADAARGVSHVLREALAPGLWEATLAADAELERLCRSLYPDFARYRARRRAAA
jgi:pyruvate-formate lyase-activating enzyme